MHKSKILRESTGILPVSICRCRNWLAYINLLYRTNTARLRRPA
jgi:hypothetical protein